MKTEPYYIRSVAPLKFQRTNANKCKPMQTNASKPVQLQKSWTALRVSESSVRQHLPTPAAMFRTAKRVTSRPAATQIHPKLTLRALRALQALLSVLIFTDSRNTVLALRTLYDQALEIRGPLPS